MQTKIKVIETKFKGVLYRSRTEARWAVFFTALNIPFDYEPEAFVVGDSGYLPDFLLPIQDCYLEVKGKYPTDEEEIKARTLAQQSGIQVNMFWGNPKVPILGSREISRAYFPDGSEDDDHWFCRCPKCVLIGISYTGLHDRLRCDCEKFGSAIGYDDELLVAAYQNAAAFRFDEWRK